MDQIQSMKFAKLRNNEHFQFMTDVNNMITDITPATLNIENVLPEFISALNELNKVFQVDRGSTKTQQLVVLDELRDRTWSAIYARVRATLICPVEKEVESAKLVKRVFDLYGNVRQMTYNEETAALINLLEDLEKEANAPHCAVIGITKWLNELKKQNDEFQEVLNARNSEFANKNSGDVKNARKVIDPAYEKIVERLNALVTLDMATPEIESFIKELNQLIKYYESTLAARSGRKEVDEEIPVSKEDTE